jgi:hypothetical protein
MLYNELFGFTGDLPSLLFGNGLSRGERKTPDRRFAALSGMTLDSHFRPSLLLAKQLKSWSAGHLSMYSPLSVGTHSEAM